MSRSDLSWVRDRGECTEPDDLAYDAERYAYDVIDHNDLDLELDELEFNCTRRMTRIAGNCRFGNGDGYTIGISWKRHRRHGWSDTKKTVRHELAHVMQHKTEGFTDHGVGFHEWMEQLEDPT